MPKSIVQHFDQWQHAAVEDDDLRIDRDRHRVHRSGQSLNEVAMNSFDKGVRR